MIRVLVVDDHPLVRTGLASMLEGDDVEIVGEAARVSEVADTAEACHPDIILLDARLPDGDGWEACEEMRDRGIDVPVILLTQLTTERVITDAFAAGVSGFVVKASDSEVIWKAIDAVLAGDTFLDPEVTGRIASQVARLRNERAPHGLTAAELRVVALVPDGLTNKEIGRQLGLSPETVKTHLRNAMRKVGVQDRTQLASAVVREDLA